MRQLNMLYHFDVEQDLMDKAMRFIQLLHRMQECDRDLVQVVRDAMKDMQGKIADKTNEAIEQYQKRNEWQCEMYQNSMKTAALRYTNMINDMRGQNITLYYDVIVREMKG
ncbi:MULTISPECIES: hypothetical protein [Geobacillus]|uniref:hypothetical protein n=1 Tax=Geobacillus TaxID=129337 RepID=UPI0006E568ED|nr:MULTISPECIES: hypothetical protein [Geobacillus]KQB94591.1 hypothetical protein GEPA3_0436 [Geobacillus sp. PA-3]MEC5189135.1 vacuolar-type H+-ATPase subunit D/Vma8 [Geobacillus thermodenitrificans]MED0664294.1 hypothetical protein [Geobacillus thermodenitrificans]MED4916292.1 hypothetical protein [Geobacillus thermodenitrificans]